MYLYVSNVVLNHTFPCLLSAAKSSSNLSSSLQTFSMRVFSGSEAAAAAWRPWMMMFRTADSPVEYEQLVLQYACSIFVHLRWIEKWKSPLVTPVGKHMWLRLTDAWVYGWSDIAGWSGQGLKDVVWKRYGGNDIDGLDMSQNRVRMLKMVEKCNKQDGGRSSLTP